ncbi:MAG: hypothetical protein ACXW06_06695 [Halobacteriota archaeon]
MAKYFALLMVAILTGCVGGYVKDVPMEFTFSWRKVGGRDYSSGAAAPM